MISEVKDNDVYGLLTQLCHRLLEQNCSTENHQYLTQRNRPNIIKQLRAKAFKILLKGLNHEYRNKVCDPIAELFKFIYKLKVELCRHSEARELEKLMDILLENEQDMDPVTFSILSFLNELKSTEYKEDKSLNIFFHKKMNDSSEESINEIKRSIYQIYPLEVCRLPKRFGEVLSVDHDSIIKGGKMYSSSNLSIINRSKSKSALDIGHLRFQNNQKLMFPVLTHGNTFTLTTEFSMSSYFLPDLQENNMGITSNLNCSKESIVTKSETSLQDDKEKKLDNIKTNDLCNDHRSSHALSDKNGIVSSSVIWESIHELPPVKNVITWETLGILETRKEPPFLSETNEAVLHLANLRQAGIFPLLPNHILSHTPLITKVSTLSFIKDIKLLLLGFESDSFSCDVTGFKLKKNLALHGISPESLENICYDVIQWGNCFRSLINLVSPDPVTGKQQIQGFIFKAMCESLKEFLQYYEAAVLQIKIDEDEKLGLLKSLNAVRPLGSLIVEVAEICQCNSLDKTDLGEGIGILTHIYEQVIKVTKPNVALVLYSILKSCCEVYFQFLRQWIFEGICEDVYGEFMIKVKPHYLRLRERKFWTRAFTINTQSVPGFLGNLTELILQCGKTVRLMKICDSKNPVCLSMTCQPHVRVCLNTTMLQEQLKFCEKYREEGDKALGSIVSLWSAFQEQEAEEKRRADLVIMAQQDTLLRLKKEKEEILKRIVEEKAEYLEKLKDQAQEVAMRKEKDKNEELLADKLFLENLAREEEEARNLEREEKIKILKYYNELADEARQHKLRTDWRLRRMNLFDKRVELILSAKKEMRSLMNEFCTKASSPSIEDNKRDENFTIIRNDEIPVNIEITDNVVSNENIEVSKAIINEKMESKLLSTEMHDTDENFNPAINQSQAPSDNNLNTDNKQKVAEKKTPVRPTLLKLNESSILKERKSEGTISDKAADTQNVKRNMTLSNPLLKSFDLFQPEIEFMTESDKYKNIIETNCLESREVTLAEARKNKMRVMQDEFGIISPNNNEAPILLSKELTQNANFIPALSELQINRLKNTQQQIIDNWEQPVETKKIIKTPSECLTEAERNKLRNMSHHFEQEISIKPDKSIKSSVVDNEECLVDERTPMSCATDYFTSSMNSSSIQIQSCENTPFSEFESDNQIPMTFNEIVDTPKLITNLNLSHNEEIMKNLNSFGFSINATNTQTFESSLTIVDVETLDTTSLAVYLEKSVIIPLRIQCKLINNAMIKYLLQEHNIISHLRSLRNYFFLLNGEFAKSLTHYLFRKLYEVSTPFELFNSTTLKTILNRAIISSLSGSYMNSELLSLSATSLPNHLQVSNPEILDCLSLGYEISWPLNIIFDRIVMEQYTKVFKFLLMVGRVLWVLEEDFYILKTESQAANSEQYHKIQLYRHSMMQFINALHSYLTCSVLHASWTEFEKDLKDATTLDEIFSIHISYLKKILSRCMLYKRDEKMRECLRNIFTVVLKFHNQIRSRKWVQNSTGVYVHPNYTKVESMYKSFCKLRAFMAHVANKLANSGYQPHFTHFLHALNINHLYDITSNLNCGV